MELVGIPHGELPKGLKVLRQKGLLDGLHALRHDGGDAVGQQRGCGHRRAHSRSRGRVLLGVRDHQNDGPKLRPVGFVGDLHRQRIAPRNLVVAAAFRGSGPPGHESAVEGPTGRSAALPGQRRELPGIGFRGVHQLRQCGHQCGVSGGARGQSGGGGKCVVAGNVDLEILPLGRVRRQELDAVHAGPEALARRSALLFGAVQPQAVALEALAGSGGGHGAEIGLVQSDGDRVVGGSVELGVGLAPVFDAGNVGGGRDGGHVDGGVFSFGCHCAVQFEMRILRITVGVCGEKMTITVRTRMKM
mmetsp:Transcript_13679/g.31909  ORF Transcript_13679/g.31909 Transcript_13679/m.31909 type:complete len:303 (+) Transcript_13679:538-1446(+)